MIFESRVEAGRLLSEKLSSFSNSDGSVVLSIPRGGVVVGAEVSRLLNLPLEVIITKKIGAPGNEELAIGAVAEDGEPILDSDLVGRLGVDKRYLKNATKETHKKIADYILKFRDGRKLEVFQKTVIVTDDGVATGYTVEAALSWLSGKKPKEVVLAIPTGARDSMKRLERMADKTVCLDKPLWFSAVGQFYREFGQVSDEEVRKILASN